MNSPLVSIVLPTYNRAKIIGRAIDSVLKQKITDWELIVVDDGSNYSNARLLEKIIKVDKRIKLVRQKNSGLTVARNMGSQVSRGKFIAYLDDDDYYLPNHLDRGISYLKKHPEVAMVYSRVKVIGSAYVPDARNPKKMIHISKCGNPGTFIIRHRILRLIGWWQGNYFGEDYRLRMNLRRKKHKVVKLPSANYVYNRSYSNSITNKIEHRSGGINY